MSRYSRKREYDMRDEATALLSSAAWARPAAATGTSAAAVAKALEAQGGEET